MKRTMLSLLLLALTVCGAMAQNDAMYVYRNDGAINAFLKADIDSIRHSPIDLDSVMHAENVTQEVWTVDSVYRIPLAAIDSVSFVTPPTVYKDDVTRLEYNLLDYVIGAEGRTLKLKYNTPKNIIPVKGDKLVLLEGCDVLPNGFSGIVSSVKRGYPIEVVCEQAYLEDLFDSFCCVSTAYGRNPEDGPEAVRVVSGSGRQRVVYNPNDITLPLGPYKASCSSEISQGIVPGGDLALSGGASFSVEIQPTFRIHTFLRYGCGEPETYFQCSITGDLRITSESSLYGGLSFNHDFDKVVYYYPIPQTADLVNFYINPGVFVRANATITSKATTTHVYTFGMTFDYSSRGGHSVQPKLGGRLASSSVDLEGCFDGSLAGGGYIEAGFSLLCREIARVCVRGEVGYQWSSNFVLRNSDIDKASEETTLYERLKASSFEMGPFVNVGLYASVGTTEAPIKWELSSTDLKCDYVPTFSNTKLTRTSGSSTSVDAYTELRGNCLVPVPVGFKLFDENKNEVDDCNANASYNNIPSKFKHTFGGLKEDVRYKVYPKVKLFDHDILASPAAELDPELLTCPDDQHPHAISLGLPSGTKWCCCNVGASKPEEYGGYYAWGETREKRVYNDITYKYFNVHDGNSWSNNKDVVIIGSDIAGTGYDAATVNMGAPWRMPSIAQLSELASKCTRQWTQQNGVNGILMTGKNGGQIFLPAAGYRWDGDLSVAGKEGRYWSSSHNPEWYSYACWGGFTSSRWNSVDTSGRRSFGYSIRPVVKQ